MRTLKKIANKKMDNIKAHSLEKILPTKPTVTPKLYNTNSALIDNHLNSYGLHWFRRDLRIVNNPALMKNINLHEGRVLGVFFFDSTFLSRKDFSYNRFGFFLKTLDKLKDEMHTLGGELIVLDSTPCEGFRTLFKKIEKLNVSLPKVCSFNRDYEPFAQKRDESVIDLLDKTFHVTVLIAADHLLIEPDEIKKSNGTCYQIFTPFYNAWLKKLSSDEISKRVENAVTKPLQASGKIFHITWKKIFKNTAPFKDALEKFINDNKPHVKVALPPAGSHNAYLHLMEFKKNVSDYENGRNYPDKPCTSKLSIYLKNGSLTSAQIFHEFKSNAKAKSFLRQIVWREFYYYILFHHPNVEHESFKEKYRKIAWENRTDWFEAWKYGKTGYPIVDAGMRQLLKTGLMHNRVRMIVASFLTKDLLIDWRWGEKWFMQNLLDGDLAANNGGWQWAASTGCDPQPYFRIFNPLLQSRQYDPNGDYIRTYVPELKELSYRDIHAPPENIRPKSYPAPIVNHAEQKRRALLMYRKVN